MFVRWIRAIPSGRDFRSNLRCAPISAAIPIASVRSRSLRAPLARKADRPCRNVGTTTVHNVTTMVPKRLTGLPNTTSNSGDPSGPGSTLQSPLRSDFRCDPCRLRSLALTARLPSTRTRRADTPHTVPDSDHRTSCVSGAGFAAHLAPHSCGRHCRRLRQRASHDCPRRCPRSPSLNRRGGSPPPASPASIPPSLIPQFGRSGPPGAGFGSHTRRIVDAVRAGLHLRRLRCP